MTSEQNELTDSNYIHWAEKEEWSLTQAVYLLLGFVPQKRELTIDQLDDFIKIQPKQNLEARIYALNQKLKKHDQDTGKSKIDPKIVGAYLAQFRADLVRYEADLKEFPGTVAFLENLPKPAYKNLCPEDWVVKAINYIPDHLTDCWRAIFPWSIPDDLEYTRGKIPNYRWFIQVFTRDTKSPLKKLIECVLNLGKNSMTDPPAEFDDILHYMDGALGINVKEFGKLLEWMVFPREFIEKCRPQYFYYYFNYSDQYGHQCRRWIYWLSEHPVLADWLKASGKAKKSAKSNKETGDPLEETHQLIVSSYISDVQKGLDKKGLPGLKNKISELKNHQLKSVSMTIGEKWPDAESLRTSISRKYGSPKTHEDVRKAKASVNPFNQ